VIGVKEGPEESSKAGLLYLPPRRRQATSNMIRCALRGDGIRKRVLVVSTQESIIRFFSDGTKSVSKLQRPESLRVVTTVLTDASDESDEKTMIDGKNDSMGTKEVPWGNNKKKFVPFFEEIDNMDSSASIASFFRSLGTPPPAKRKTTMPPPPPPTPPRAATPFKAEKQSVKSASFPDSPLGGQSIFDAFPIPDAPLANDPNAYDNESYRQYRDLIDEVLDDDKYQRQHTRRPFTDEFIAPIKAWLQAAEPKVKYNLPLLQASVEQGLNFNDVSKEFRNELNIQRQVFLETIPLNEKQYTQASIALHLIGNMCAKRARSLPLDVAWEKMKEAGMCFDKVALNSYLYSCTVYVGRRKSGPYTSGSGDSILDMLGSAPSRTSAPKLADDKDEEYVVNLPEEVATFHDLLYEPSEESVTIRIKALVAKGNASGAEALLDRFVVRESCRIMLLLYVVA